MLLKLKKNKKGFTLIELIVVVAILAILAAIAVPNFIGLSAKAQQGVDIANATSIASAVNVFNSLQTDATKKITDTTKVTEGNLGTLWPSGLKAGDVANAVKRISFKNEIAIVDPTMS